MQNGVGSDPPVARPRRRAPPLFGGLGGLLRACRGRRERTNILEGATGQAKLGELVGVLGPSGARPACRPGSCSERLRLGF